MYWVQTKSNLNNIIEVKELLADCHRKEIKEIIIGNEGSHQWYEIEKEINEMKYNLKITYSIYKKDTFGNVLWIIKGNVLENAAKLEKAYETENYKDITNSVAVPIIIPKNEDAVGLPKIYEKLFNLVGDAYIGKTSENEKCIKELQMKSYKKVLPLQRVRFLEPNDKEITDIRRQISGETTDDIVSGYDTFLKPPKFLSEEFEKTDTFLKGIVSFLEPNGVRQLELWNKKKIGEIELPNDWDRFFTKKIELPENIWELKKIYLLCVNAGNGFNKRYASSPHKETALKRLKKELTVIVEGAFYDYFLVIEDICNYAQERKIRIGQRGSVVGSLLAYCLGISNVDPFAYD